MGSEWRKRCAAYVHAVHQYQWEPAPFGWDYDAKSYESCLWAARQHAKAMGREFGVERLNSPGQGVWYRYFPLPPRGQRFDIHARCEVVRCE